jgi:hypothetical protein
VKPSILYHDLRRLVGSARAHLRERRNAAQADLGIGWLAARGQHQNHPHLRRYEAAITDLGATPRRLQLTLEQWQAPHPGAGRGRINHVTVTLHSRPHAQRILTWLTDSDRVVRAFTEGEELETVLRRDQAPLRGRCATVVGLWLQELQMDRVTVYETFPGGAG